MALSIKFGEVIDHEGNVDYTGGEMRVEKVEDNLSIDFAVTTGRDDDGNVWTYNLCGPLEELEAAIAFLKGRVDGD